MMENSKLLDILSKNYSSCLDIVDIKFERQGGNKTYSVFTNSNRYFLKLIGKTFFDTFKQAIDINLYLLNIGFFVPNIVLTNDSFPFIKIELDNETKYLVLYEHLELNDIDVSKNAKDVGKTLGLLHKNMKFYDKKLLEHDKTFYIDRYINILKQKKYVRIDGFIDYGNRLWDRIKELPRGYSHGDMYSGNIVIDNKANIYVLDFDTSCIGFTIYDLALICNQTNYFKYDDKSIFETKKVYNELLSEYLKYNQLTTNEINSIYDMIALYHFTLQATIIETYGIDCVDNLFFDSQLEWLQKWEEQSCKM